MIKSLHYKVSFPTTGRTFENNINFEPGLTAIVGANESGKSLILEFIRYAWFGKSALRGKASDYKNLTVRLIAEVKGQKIQIIREPKNEQLLVDEKVRAVGAEAINAFVPIFLGFPLSVHDVALTALQDNLHVLTDMKPTARRAMIDQLTGTNTLESVEKDCRAQAREKMKVAEALIVSVQEPVAPSVPDNIDMLDELVTKRNEAHALIGERRVLEAVPFAEEPSEPKKLYTNIDELQQHEDDRRELEQNTKLLERELELIPVASVNDDQYNLYLEYRIYRNEADRRGPKPEYDADQLDNWLRILNSTIVECPKCGTEFEPDSGSIIDTPEEPPISKAEIFEQQRRLANWSQPLKEVIYDGPEFDFEQEQRAREQADRRAEIQRQLEEQQTLPDRSTELRQAIDNQREWATYETSKDRWERYKQAQEKLEVLEEVENLSEIETQISDIETYLRNKQVYDQALATFVKVSQKAEVAKAEAEGFEAGVKALKATRLVVKQELVPSLSKAASYFLSSFTDGERNRIIIDQDFNIEVDKQPVDTLSGSGKAVVNLALRIALAQVLTSQVLSLFMGDEIDGSMDSQRADATHKTFRNITRHLEQVILVTHKDIDADHIIRIEE